MLSETTGRNLLRLFLQLSRVRSYFTKQNIADTSLYLRLKKVDNKIIHLQNLSSIIYVDNIVIIMLNPLAVLSYAMGERWILFFPVNIGTQYSQLN